MLCTKVSVHDHGCSVFPPVTVGLDTYDAGLTGSFLTSQDLSPSLQACSDVATDMQDIGSQMCPVQAEGRPGILYLPAYVLGGFAIVGRHEEGRGNDPKSNGNTVESASVASDG